MFGHDKRILSLKKEENNFWPTFTDLLSVVVLVFLLLVISFMVVAQMEASTNQRTQEELQTKVDDLNQIVDDIIGFRKEIASDLRQEFTDTGLVIDVDNAGAITFSGDILFNTDSEQIKPEFIEMLKIFIPKYVGVLLDDKYRNNISQIVIEGHTDDSGSYMYNLELSQKRAFSVAKYILSEEFIDFNYKGLLKKYLTATGKSESVLKLNEDGTINKDASRRVEFKFNIKDEILINKMKEVINTKSINRYLE